MRNTVDLKEKFGHDFGGLMEIGDIVKNERVDCGFVFNKNKKHYNVIPVKVGLNIECDGDILKNIQSEQYIKDNFKLNIKEIRENWYRVYFDNKE